MQNEYLTDALHELGLISRKVQGEFGKLSTEQLNWKPGPDQWSIAQCLDHLIKTNEQYFPLFKNISTGKHKRSVWGYIPGLPAFWGKLMLKSIDPSSTKKLKAPAIFRPGTSNIPTNIVADFIQHQQEFIQIIKATDQVNHTKVIVASPVSSLINYSLKDCVNICVTHEERHFLQAKRVLKLPSFPATVNLF